MLKRHILVQIFLAFSVLSCMTVDLFSQEGEFYLIGHAHIDPSWLWPRSETIHEVCPLTFRSVMQIMDQHPDFVYAQSAAQLYKWMERYYPDIFEGIKA